MSALPELCAHGMPSAWPCTDYQGWTRADEGEDPGGLPAVPALEQLQVAGAGEDPWPDPQPLAAPASPFPVDALPAGMAAAVREAAERALVDPAVPAMAFLASLSGAIGADTCVGIKAGWCPHCNLYLAVLARTGDGKTPGIREGLQPLRDLDSKIRRNAARQRSEATALKPLLKRALADAQKADKPDMAELGKLQQQLEAADRDAMRDGRLIADDVTPEKLVELLADSGGRLVLVNDEGAILSHLLGAYSANPLLDPFLKGWDGAQLTVDRKGGSGRAGTSALIERPLLTVFVAVQPAVLARFGEPKHRYLVDRGVPARLLFAYPPSRAGSRMLTGVPDPGPAVKAANWNARVMALSGESTLSLDAGALKVFEAWHDRYERDIAPNGQLEDLQDFVPKLRESVARIAGLFARVDDSPVVTEQHMARGIQLGDYFATQARQVAQLWSRSAGVGAGANRLAQKLAALEPDAQGRRVFTVRDAVRLDRRQTADAVIRSLEHLAGLDIVRPCDPAVGFGSAGRQLGKQSPKVELNPRFGADAMGTS